MRVLSMGPNSEPGGQSAASGSGSASACHSIAAPAIASGTPPTWPTSQTNKNDATRPIVNIAAGPARRDCSESTLASNPSGQTIPVAIHDHVA